MVFVAMKRHARHASSCYPVWRIVLIYSFKWAFSLFILKTEMVLHGVAPAVNGQQVNRRHAQCPLGVKVPSAHRPIAGGIRRAFSVLLRFRREADQAMMALRRWHWCWLKKAFIIFTREVIRNIFLLQEKNSVATITWIKAVS
jgi:hypothetical protein